MNSSEKTFFAISAVGVAVCLLTIVFNLPLPWLVSGIVVSSAAFAIGVVLYSVRKQRELDAAVKAACEALGLKHEKFAVGKGDAPAFAPYASVTPLNHGHKGLQWIARGILRQRPVELFQHSYTVSTGKSSHHVFHTCSAVDCPPHWPEVRLAPEGVLHRLGEKLGFRDIKIEDDAFNARWRVTSADPDFAQLLLGPEVQRFLLDAPKIEQWGVFSGKLVCLHSGKVEPDKLAALAPRAAELFELIPRELANWRPQS